MNRYDCGLVSISFRKHSAEEIIGEVKKNGLCCIEWGSDVHACHEDDDAIGKIVSLQKEAGIFTSSYGTYFRFGESDVCELEGYILAAKKLGTDILRLWCGTKGSLDYTDEEKEEIYNAAREAAKIAEKHQVYLCMECHPNTLTDRKESALELMKAVDSPWFKMYWQPNQFETIDENIRYIKLLKPYITHIHVFNWEGSEHYPLRDNPDKWIAYLNELGEEKRVLLLEFMPDHRIESLKEEAEALEDIIKAIKHM